MESRRKAWVERVAGWRRSGLTAKEYAARIGVNAGTLAHWAWRLGHEQRRRQARHRSGGRASTVPAALIEVVSRAKGDDRFELCLDNGRRLHVPAGFEIGALQRLLEVLEAKR